MMRIPKFPGWEILSKNERDVSEGNSYSFLREIEYQYKFQKGPLSRQEATLIITLHLTEFDKPSERVPSRTRRTEKIEYSVYFRTPSGENPGVNFLNVAERSTQERNLPKLFKKVERIALQWLKGSHYYDFIMNEKRRGQVSGKPLQNFSTDLEDALFKQASLGNKLPNVKGWELEVEEFEEMSNEDEFNPDYETNYEVRYSYEPALLKKYQTRLSVVLDVTKYRNSKKVVIVAWPTIHFSSPKSGISTKFEKGQYKFRDISKLLGKIEKNYLDTWIRNYSNPNLFKEILEKKKRERISDHITQKYMRDLEEGLF